MSTRRSREEMFAIIEQWESSQESREAFCQSHNLPVSTFSYWRTKYAKAKEQPREPGFVQLKPRISDNLEVIYPNGVRVKVPQGSSLADLRALIQLV